MVIDMAMEKPTPTLIAVRNSQETRHLVTNQGDPEPRNEDRNGDSGKDGERLWRAWFTGPEAAGDRREREYATRREEPHDDEQHDGKLALGMGSVHQFQDQERKHEDGADDGGQPEIAELTQATPRSRVIHGYHTLAERWRRCWLGAIKPPGK